MSKFTVAIDNFVVDTKAKLEAVWKQSVQDTFDLVLDKWPVDTGFSRKSFVASTSGWAPITSEVRDPKATYQINYDDLTVAIAGAELGETIYGNFTANYAVYIEYGSNGRAGRGLVRMAAMAWPQTVAKNVQRLKKWAI